jgi:zinc transporter ZupT
VLPEILCGVALCLAHYGSGFLASRLERVHAQLLSFSAGISIAILFNELLPIAVFSLASFEGVFLGFVAFHVLENFAYLHTPQRQRERGIIVVDILAFTFNNLLRGLLVVFSFRVSVMLGLFTTLVVLLHAVSSSFMFEHLLERFSSMRRLKLAFSLSPLVGVLIALPLVTVDKTFFTIFSVSIGALLYIVIRDLIPQPGNGKTGYFILGALLAFVFSSLH